MVKPRKERRVQRRLLTISLYVTAWILLTLLAPAWAVAGAIVGMVRRRSFVTLRLLVFAWVFFGTAIVALLRLTMAFTLLRAKPDELTTHLFELQRWWSTTLLQSASRILRLQIEVENVEAAIPGPSILLVRHASILDTLLTSVYVQAPTHWHVRYILKQELLFDPCLDIVGNALPNYFVDRTGNRQREFEGIRKLVEDLGRDGVLIYPEGTRFSPSKLAHSQRRARKQNPGLTQAIDALTDVLPPRPGGVLTLLEALPGVDCVLFAHCGLEGLEKVKDVLSGSIIGAVVRGRLWRVPRSEIPDTDRERIRWLFEQWAVVNAYVKSSEAE